MQVVFDSVVLLATDTAPRRELEAREFLEMPLHERVQAIVQRRVEFYANGTRVDQKAALRSLRTAG